MIHAFALEPELVATWGRREAFRFVQDKFGLGTVRTLFEYPKFTTWKRAVYNAATAIGLSQQDMLRIEELFKIFADHRSRRAGTSFDGTLPWLVNAEQEFDRRPFSGIVASTSPRNHSAVILWDQLDAGTGRWALSAGATVDRTPQGLATALSAMLTHSREIHIVDPHFGPGNPRHHRALEELTVLAAADGTVRNVYIHCSAKTDLAFFESEASALAGRTPATITLCFRRWKERDNGDKLHNRYVLTDLGGVSIGMGVERGRPGETDDVLLLPRDQYLHRWKQYAEQDGSFELEDTPADVIGQRTR